MNIAMISGWHVHAKGYAKQLREDPSCHITSVWDEDRNRGAAWAQELGCPFQADYSSILSDPSIQAVVITAPTRMHPDLMIRAAKAGKHIFTEKVLSITGNDAKAIRKAVLDAQIVFSVSFPHRFAPSIMYARQMVSSGALGDINYARVRNVHNGSLAGWLPESFYNLEDCGGGAMIDLGAHPLYLLEWILGKPVSVFSSFLQFAGKGVEDNAVSVFEFKGGVMGIAETGFVSVYTPLTMEIGGTKGSLIVRNGVSYANEATRGEWVSVTNLDQPGLPPILQWTQAAITGSSPAAGIDEAVTLTFMMEAAYHSFRTDKKVLIRYE